MKSSPLLTPLTILLGSLLIAAAIYLHPGSNVRTRQPVFQGVVVDNFLYIIDGEKGELKKIIPTK